MVLNTINNDISADYAGPADKKVEEVFGNNTLCMFIQGGGGNINPMFMTDDKGFRKINGKVQTDFSYIETMDNLLADEVIETAKRLSPKKNEKASLKAMSDSLSFTGRFDKKLTYNMHFTTVLINDDIAIATMQGEPFVMRDEPVPK